MPTILKRRSPRESRERPRQRLTLAAWALLLALAWALTAPLSAQEPLRVVQREQRYVFSQSLEFTLSVESASPVVEAVLFYGRQGVPLVRRIYPEFTPGTRATLRHTELLERGQFAPGTVFRTWWQLTLQDGTVQRTPVETFEYTDDNHPWQPIASERVVLYYYGKARPLAEELLGHAEEAIARLQEQIGVSIQQQARIYVYNNARDMEAALSTRSETYDSRVVTLGVAVGEDTLLLLGDHRDVRQTLAHELSHIIVGLATDNPYADLPRWLDEGLAMYAEGELPLDNRRALERAIQRDALPSIRSLSSYTSRASEVDLFYGAAYSVVEFMLCEYGRDKMSALLAVFAEGSRQEDALQRVYGLSLNELDAQWRSSLGLGPRGAAPQTAPTPQAAPTPSAGGGLGNAARQLLELLRRAWQRPLPGLN